MSLDATPGHAARPPSPPLPDGLAMVALDWGSSRLRAYALGADGRLLAQRASGDGASTLAAGPAAFAAALRALAGDWCASGVPLWACGMVGSAHGWAETPYVDGPLDLMDLRAAVRRVHGVGVGAGFAAADLHIVPGVCWRGPDPAADVMRGEETQLLGLRWVAPERSANARVLMPGTHSKWVWMRDGRLQHFATRMTGELFALLCRHSVLARVLRPTAADSDERAPSLPDPAAFDAGVAEARRGGGSDLARHLFGLRAEALLCGLDGAAAAERLSGLLIGAEVAAGLASAGDDALPLLLVGEPALCQRWQRALAAFGRQAEPVASGGVPLAARGLWALAQAAASAAPSAQR